MIHLKHFLTIFLFLSTLTIYAQTWDFLKADTTDANKTYPRQIFGQTKVHFGGHFSTGVDGLEEVERNYFSALELRVGWKGYGRKKWHKLFGYPNYGFGLYQATFFPEANILGSPSAMYGFFNAPFRRYKKWSLMYDLGVGLAYDFFGYDPKDNPDQTAIGSEFNVYFTVSVEGEFKISPRIDGTVGLLFTHFSNGRTRTPNKGVNLYGLNAGIKYNFNTYIPKKGSQFVDSKKDPRLAYIDHTFGEFKPFWEYYTFVAGGWSTSPYDIQDRELYYGVGTIAFDVARHYSYKGKYGIGIDVFHDGSLVEEYQSQYPNGVPNSKLWYAGIHFSHELLIHRITLVTQVGIPFTNVEGRGGWYARVGGRYDFSRKFFAHLALKTPGGFIADFVEWGVGFRMYSNNKDPRM
ncbi:acyloxyacyl hydrolase [Flammeovirga sp. EKP202]|uniref:acyloxyacyl hydrolase n=1 Tax=Flammeovirga sp. EKP202 TaxID=2770592 RepID=UPI00165FFEE2|nr:acyloxyacyl hydrolase [Flammeovirga sp. EKP202]MBD0400160.1 acyloxyacyl hydrolase [Flammeovirga sp. EKP202]